MADLNTLDVLFEDELRDVYDAEKPMSAAESDDDDKASAPARRPQTARR
jgi:hypothetical protein